MEVSVLLCAILVLNGVQSAKILGVFPLTAPSHFILGSALMKGLAERGHDVTIITSFVEKNPPKNGSYREIILTGFVEDHERGQKEMNMFDLESANMFIVVPMFCKMFLNTTELTLSHPNVQKLLKSNEKFDLVIIEQFMNEALKGLAPYFDAPLVLLSTVGANTWINILVGNPSPPSYIPDIFLSYSPKMTFCERMINSLMYSYAYLMYHLWFFPEHRKMYEKHFPNAPDFDDTIYNTSIVLLNSHPSVNQPVPYVPNMIDIGGYHINPPKKLPQDLQKFLDEAKDGVIYFSLGSHIKSAMLPLEKREAFLKTFAKLKEKVLWKWEEDTLPDQPKNVKLGKWLPQQDILAHPNVKLFITHGGLLSTTETIYHGKPVLAIPIGADQKINAERIVDQGFGLSLRFPQVSEKTLTEKLTELLTNPKYAKNAKIRSELFHDRQVKPMDTAAYWMEYLIRHRGAPHLKVAGLNLPWYKYFLLDVIAVVTAGVVVAVYVLFKLIRAMFSLCSKPKRKIKQN